MKRKIRFVTWTILLIALFMGASSVFAESTYPVDNIIATETDANEKITVLVENVRVEHNAAQLMSENSTTNVVTVTFDVTNTSSRAEELNIYAAVYKGDMLYSTNVEKQIFQSKDKKQILLKVNVPNNGNNTYGKIFVWDNDMQPASEYTPFEISNNSPSETEKPSETVNPSPSQKPSDPQETETPNVTTSPKASSNPEDPSSLSDVVLNNDFILPMSISYKNVTLQDGTIDLHGYTLHVYGDLIQTGGMLYINNGQLIVDGDYRIQTPATETNQYGNITEYYASSSGTLNMTKTNDKVLVNGDFYMQSWCDHTDLLTNGVLELKGNFEQINGENPRYDIHNFNATQNHKVIFSGDSEQSIKFDDEFDSLGSGFADVNFQNPNINIQSRLRGWILRRDTVIDHDVNYGIGLISDVNSGNGMDLHGHKLEITGSYLQTDGTMYINGGTLTIGKDYRIQSLAYKTDQYGDTTEYYASSDGILNMTNANDKVLVNGDFYTSSGYNHTNHLTNGVLELKGNFEQKNEHYGNFNAEKNHKVVFSGDKQQSIKFESTDSGFADVDFQNTNINIQSELRGWLLRRDTIIDNDVNFGMGNGIAIYVENAASEEDGKAGMDLNGHTLQITGSYLQTNGVMYINGGSLIIGKDYRIQTYVQETDQYGNISNYYASSSGLLNMTNATDSVLVNGDFYTFSGYDHTDFLTNGVLELKGGFTQINSLKKKYDENFEWSGDYRNFNASQNHKVVFSGDKQQSVKFESTGSGFADADFRNKKINIQSELRGWVLRRNTVIDGDVNHGIGLGIANYASDGTETAYTEGEFGMDLHGHKLEITGSYMQTDGTMYINGGTLSVGKDYRIQTKKQETDQYGNTTEYYAPSNGILNMTNDNDTVLVKGNFYTQAYDHSSYLKNGILELKGNFEQISGDSYYSHLNFNASQKHKVIFSGDKQQSIKFGTTDSGFADVDFQNTNINIQSELRGWILKRDTVIDNDVDFGIGVGIANYGTNTSYEDGTYGMNLHGYTLEIKGSYMQTNGIMYINNGSLVIGKDYRIQTKKQETDQYGSTTEYYAPSNGILNMTNDNDTVLVKGNFYTQAYDHSSYLKNGILELKGNFEQISGDSYYSHLNFNASQKHKVIFSGDKQQSIKFGTTDSGFADVDFQNTNINIQSDLRGWILKRNMVINNDVNYSLGIGIANYATDGSESVYADDAGMDLNGFTLEITGSYTQARGVMYINNGSLVIGKDYNIVGEGTQEFKATAGTVIFYNVSNGILNMTKENDRVLVKGNMLFVANDIHKVFLTNGVLEIKGNFSANSIKDDSGWDSSVGLVMPSPPHEFGFSPRENHKTILSGSGHQNATFNEYDSYSQFNILILTKPYETGYTFSRVPCWETLYQADSVSINYGGNSGTYAPTGNYSREFTDMTILSAAGDMPIKRTYNSQDEETSVFNQGWTLSVSAKLTDEGNGYKQVKLPDGSTAMFKENNGAYEAMNSRNTLVKNEDSTYTLSSKSLVKYRFSSDGKILSMQDRYGNTTSFETNSSGNVTVLTEPSGKRYTFSYSSNKLASIKDETAGTTVSYNYTDGRLTKATNPAGVNTYYEYDGNGRLSKILDHDKNTVEEIAYNNDNKVRYVIDADGNKSTYSYDLTEGKTTITDSNGRKNIQWFDTSFNVTKNQDAEGGTTATAYNMTDGMNKYNEPRSVTDRNGRNTYYERDNRGNVTRQSNPDGSYITYEYDDNNNIIKERNENGNYTYYIYDDTKTKLLKQVKPLDGVSSYSTSADQDQFAITEFTYYGDEYKIKGLVKSKTEPEGLITEFTYDTNGMLSTTTITDTKDGTTGTTQYHYNNAALMDYEISPDGYKTTYEYDTAGNPTKYTLNNGSVVGVIQYDAAGRKIKEISPKEYASSGLNAVGKTYAYYSNGRVRYETDSLGNKTEYTYDLYGNLKTQTNADGSVYKYEYDKINRKTKEYFKDKNSVDFALTNEYSYSVNNAKNTETTETVYLNDTDSITTVNELDYGERLVKQTRADGTEVTKSYDGKGNVKTETDANGNTKTYTYNALDKVIQEKIPFDGTYQYKKYSYDSAGNCIRTEVTNQASGEAEDYSVTEYSYNSRGMLTLTAGYDNGVIKSAAQYVYDNMGHKVRVYTGITSPLTVNGIDDVVENGDTDYAVRKYEYDYSGNITKAIDAMGMAETYAYDNNSNCISHTDRNGITSSYEYDMMNNLISKSAGDINYSYTYDVVGNKTGVSGAYNENYSYDGKGNLLSEITSDSQKNYTYNLQGDRTGFTFIYNGDEKVNMSYEYDNVGRVSKVLSDGSMLAEYGYDSNGNRTSVTYDNGSSVSYSFNKANLITNLSNNSASGIISEFDYTYYMNGNQKSKSDGSNIENYKYDDLGRLIAAGDTVYEYDDYNNRISMNGTSYSYDKNGRLLGGYTYDNNGNLLDDGVNTYEYDTWNRLISATEESYAYTDTTMRVKSGDTNIVNDGALTVYTSDSDNETVYLNGVNPIAYENNGSRLYYFFNAHGDTVNLTDEVGDVTKSYSYDVFGNEYDIDADDNNPIRYAGQYYDVASGNYYMNSRYYNAEIGRFLSQDSFYGSDIDVLSLNQYTYCHNDPIQYVDISGNKAWSTAKTIFLDGLKKASKDEYKEYSEDMFKLSLGIDIEDKNYFGEFGKKLGKEVLKGSVKKFCKKIDAATEYTVFEPIIESGIKNIIEEFNSSQKENREFSYGNVFGKTAEGVVMSYIKTAPGFGTVYDMCLDLKNGKIFENLTVRKVTTVIDVVADVMGYDPIDWNAGKNLYAVDEKKWNEDFNYFVGKGWSSNTAYWYAMTQSNMRTVDNLNKNGRKLGLIK